MAPFETACKKPRKTKTSPPSESWHWAKVEHHEQDSAVCRLAMTLKNSQASQNDSKQIYMISLVWLSKSFEVCRVLNEVEMVHDMRHCHQHRDHKRRQRRQANSKLQGKQLDAQGIGIEMSQWWMWGSLEKNIEYAIILKTLKDSPWTNSLQQKMLPRSSSNISKLFFRARQRTANCMVRRILSQLFQRH